jgi:hypothetical protein
MKCHSLPSEPKSITPHWSVFKPLNIYFIQTIEAGLDYVANRFLNLEHDKLERPFELRQFDGAGVSIRSRRAIKGAYPAHGRRNVHEKHSDSVLKISELRIRRIQGHVHQLSLQT